MDVTIVAFGSGQRGGCHACIRVRVPRLQEEVQRAEAGFAVPTEARLPEVQEQEYRAVVQRRFRGDVEEELTPRARARSGMARTGECPTIQTTPGTRSTSSTMLGGTWTPHGTPSAPPRSRPRSTCASRLRTRSRRRKAATPARLLPRGRNPSTGGIVLRRILSLPLRGLGALLLMVTSAVWLMALESLAAGVPLIAFYGGLAAVLLAGAPSCGGSATGWLSWASSSFGSDSWPA